MAREAPDLILLDTQLPDMEGHEVCRRLKSNKKSRMIPVIFIGLLEEVSVKIKGFDAGAVIADAQNGQLGLQTQADDRRSPVRRESCPAITLRTAGKPALGM